MNTFILVLAIYIALGFLLSFVNPLKGKLWVIKMNFAVGNNLPHWQFIVAMVITRIMFSLSYPYLYFLIFQENKVK